MDDSSADPETRAEIIRLRDEKNEVELEKRLRKRIEFGTAGLRGRMQAGFSSMNALTVIQASQGLAKFIRRSHQQSLEQEHPQPSVIIGRDARHNSKKFAMLAANAFAAEGIRVLWYRSAGPTPLVPFGVLKNREAWGVMVTASHNPARDNGYKVYASNGCQINSPMDAEIADLIEQNLEPWPTAWDAMDESKHLALDYYKDTAKMYCDSVTLFINSIKLSSGPQRPFVYTPLHGVGHSLMSRLCEQLGMKDLVTVVAEQQEPDPDFPTVAFPNPEESGALDLAMKTADAVGHDLVIANDPDADRLAVAEKVNGNWIKFTGDQLGILLASYMLDTIHSQTPDKPPHVQKKIAMLTTAVSTSMLSKIARAESIHAQETLTGFKWLGNVARRLESRIHSGGDDQNKNSSDGYTVPFGFEEALGYMFPAISYDKDGLTAAMVFVAAAEPHWRVNEGLTPYEKLKQLYGRYGYFENLNTYFVSPDVAVTRKLFEGVREKVAEKGLGEGGVQERLGMVGRLPILRWRDVTFGFDSGAGGEDGGMQLPADPNNQMVTVWSERGIRFTLRGSGTEPKIKIYIESCSDSHDEAVKAVCDVFMAVLEDWIQPCAPGVTYAERIVTSSGFVLDARSVPVLG
ncbi:phosphoglucomutase [Histoplasma capsulatum]|uniref:Phosphoglucomutase n=1 Tax=Ajellomyces capsulatus TaxID=5037 RepID=A0A8A1M5N3_AJECA|nr:phosphoglucomutase [Histoplasma capsulatum]